MLICVSVLILKHDLFNYFHIGNLHTQNNVDAPGPQLVVEPTSEGRFPLAWLGPANPVRPHATSSRLPQVYHTTC